MRTEREWLSQDIFWRGGNKSWFQSPRCPSIPLCVQASLVSPSASKCLFNMVRQLRDDTEIFRAVWIHSFLLRRNARDYQMSVRTKMMFKALFCHSIFIKTVLKGPGWLSEKLGSWCGWRCYFGFKQWKAAAVNSRPLFWPNSQIASNLGCKYFEEWQLLLCLSMFVSLCTIKRPQRVSFVMQTLRKTRRTHDARKRRQL